MEYGAAVPQVTDSINIVQLAVVAVLSSSSVAGLFTWLTKKSKSPESHNELARIGNEFAQHLLEEARIERKELRETIESLENVIDDKNEALRRLKVLLEEKDATIRKLERHRLSLGRKIQSGDSITLKDLFGEYLPAEFENHNLPTINRKGVIDG